MWCMLRAFSMSLFQQSKCLILTHKQLKKTYSDDQ
nr:MAG TPA: hypothetical protein [Caudoviricetes sp.]